jgi:putative hydrolase of the HAD superfamily
MMRSTKLVLFFDLDGTLLDQESAERWAAGQFLALFHSSFPADITIDEFCARWRQARRVHLPEFLRGVVTYDEYHRRRIRATFEDPELRDRCADARYEVFLEAYRSAWRLYDDVWPCLEVFRRHRLIVLSNGNGSLQRAKLRETGVLDRFDEVLTSDELCASKPDRAAFLMAARRIGALPERCTVIGNALYEDAVAAERAGMCGIWLNRRQSRTSVPVATIESLVQLPRLVFSERNTQLSRAG